MQSSLQGQRIVLLGASAGIGLATARAAAAEGARVIVVSSRETRVDAALTQLPDTAEGRVADLFDEEAIRTLFAELGAFDHLVYTAGDALRLSPVAQTSLADARGGLDLRVWGAYAAVKHAAPNLRTGGSIVLTSGIAAERPGAGWSVGALVCGAMDSLTRALAVELAPLRVNAVSPGVVRTELWDALDPAARDALYGATAETLPVGRVGEADDVAQVYVHLLRAGYTTGTVIRADGGAVLV